ncbi:unnamed protein product [Cuscuta campestris]|uniref:Reverse transcriptase Ty1/copia-type domain-containing protein n=1 Tax=Cuscuta campestris TaxID=132261 RepID=A0A484NRW0_9ASTE|nr:unnamed protein product [Cuscuta campestris]
MMRLMRLLSCARESKMTKVIAGSNEEEEEEEILEIPAQEEESAKKELPKAYKHLKNHPRDNIIGDIEKGVRTRNNYNLCAHYAFVSQFEPKNVEDALKDSDWIISMQLELEQFERNKESAFINPNHLNKPYGMLLTHIFAKREILEVRRSRVRFLDAECLGYCGLVKIGEEYYMKKEFQNIDEVTRAEYGPRRSMSSLPSTSRMLVDLDVVPTP